jgi:hypothetical protein
MKVYCHVHESHLLDLIPYQRHPVHICMLYFSYHAWLGFSKFSFPSDFPEKMCSVFSNLLLQFEFFPEHLLSDILSLYSSLRLKA